MTVKKGACTLFLALTLLAAVRCTDQPTSSGYYPDPLPSDLDTAAFMADTQIVRAILDSNGLDDISIFWDMIFLNYKIKLTGSRISGLDLEGFTPSLTRLPAVIGGLSELTDLRLRNNNLTFLPPEIGLLSKLTALYLNHNRISQLPRQLTRCTALQSLYATDDSLVLLPDSIGNLTALRHLEVGNNLLAALPGTIRQMDSVVVGIRNNRLCALSTLDSAWLDAHAFELTMWKSTQVCP